jgi:hypothetical protein
MSEARRSVWDEWATPAQRNQFCAIARQQRWPQALILTGWLHLLAFSCCYYLTIVQNYHEPAGYLSLWMAEFVGMGLIFLICRRSAAIDIPSSPLTRFVVHIAIAYFVLAFNLATMNALRGHRLFELFPAMASLASFAFLALTFAISRRFFVAVLVMFVAGLLMAAFLLHAYLFFAIAWWLVLNGIGITLWARQPTSVPQTLPAPFSDSQVPRRVEEPVAEIRSEAT